LSENFESFATLQRIFVTLCQTFFIAIAIVGFAILLVAFNTFYDPNMQVTQVTNKTKNAQVAVSQEKFAGESMPGEDYDT